MSAPEIENDGPKSAAREMSDRDRALSLTAVILAAFGVGLSFGIGYPLTSLTLEHWHTPEWMIGLAGAAPSFGVLLVLPFMPPFVARLGVVRAISLGCLVGATGYLALALFEDAGSWMVIRLLMSAGLALPWLAGETWINVVTREETRGRVISIYAIAFFSGYSAGSLILDRIGLIGPLPFVAGAASMALAGFPILLAARLAPDVSRPGKARRFLSVLLLAPAGMAGGFIGGFAETSYLALLPNVAIAGGLNQAEALWLLSLLTIGGVALQFAIGWLADKAPRMRVTLALAAVFIALTLALPFWLAVPFAAASTAFLLGGVILGFYTLGLAIVGEAVGPGDLVAANAAFLVMYQVGAILGPAAAGAAMMASPVDGFAWTLAAAMAMAVFLLGILPKRPPAP